MLHSTVRYYWYFNATLPYISGSSALFFLYNFWQSNINAEILHQFRRQLLLPHSFCLICSLFVLLQTSEVWPYLHRLPFHISVPSFQKTKQNLNQTKVMNTSQQCAQLAKKAESIVASIRNSVAANLGRYCLLGCGTYETTSWILCSVGALLKGYGVSTYEGINNYLYEHTWKKRGVASQREDTQPQWWCTLANKCWRLGGFAVVGF